MDFILVRTCAGCGRQLSLNLANSPQSIPIGHIVLTVETLIFTSPMVLNFKTSKNPINAVQADGYMKQF